MLPIQRPPISRVAVKDHYVDLIAGADLDHLLRDHDERVRLGKVAEKVRARAAHRADGGSVA